MERARGRAPAGQQRQERWAEVCEDLARFLGVLARVDPERAAWAQAAIAAALDEIEGRPAPQPARPAPDGEALDRLAARLRELEVQVRGRGLRRALGG